MDYAKMWTYAFYIWIIQATIGVILFSLFCHCNGSCYWTNDISREIALPLGFIFLVWSIMLIPFGILATYLEEKKLKTKPKL